MGSSSPNTDSELSEFYGRIPDEDVFDMSMSAVLRWGRPWWHINQIIASRNSRKDALTDADDFLAWKALLYKLAERVSCYNLPHKLRDLVSQRQYREDLFADAASNLWWLIYCARGKELSIKKTPWMAISRATRVSLHKIPENFSIDLFSARRSRESQDVSAVVSEAIDGNIEHEKVDRLLSLRLQCRLPAEIFPGLAEARRRAVRGQKLDKNTEWVEPLAKVHEELIRQARSALPSEEMLESSDLLVLAMIDIDPEAVTAELVSIVKPEGFIRLLQIFGGTTIKIPSIKEVKAAVKRAMVWKDYQNQFTFEELADKYSITVDAAIGIVNRWGVLNRARKVVEYS